MSSHGSVATAALRRRRASSLAFWLGFAAYLVPSFPIAYAWHLVAFAGAYHGLAMYRDDVIIPSAYSRW